MVSPNAEHWRPMVPPDAARAVIRPTTKNDLEGVVDALEIVASEGRFIATELPVDRDERRERFRASIDAGECQVVAELDGRVVGFGGLREQAPGVLSLGMALVPEVRGRGIGSQLLAALIEGGRDRAAHKLTLEVWPHNSAAIALYERFEFEREGYLRRHYRRRSGELWDSVVMGLRLVP